MPQRITRLAPSPTGALHLGNARTFLVNWALARQNNWQVVLRIEDLDTPRTKPGANQQAIDILTWLGMDWDQGPYYQVNDLSPYLDALVQLGVQGQIYPCQCTRSQIAAAALSAPNAGDHDLRYPGTCRPAQDQAIAFEPDQYEDEAWRIRADPEDVHFDDGFAGRQVGNVDQIVGDFIVAAKSGLPSYQLACVVDDARQGITDIVRGDDLIPSTPRQLMLYRKLDLTPVPNYIHLPLVCGHDGRRLAKRHGDTKLTTYRSQGTPAERVIGLLAHWCGIVDRSSVCPMTANDFLAEFALSKLPRDAVTFTPDDHRWLVD